MNNVISSLFSCYNIRNEIDFYQEQDVLLGSFKGAMSQDFRRRFFHFKSPGIDFAA
jgi:hypothetical protein